MCFLFSGEAAFPHSLRVRTIRGVVTVPGEEGMYRTEWHGVDNSGDVSEKAGADWLENVVSPRALAVAEAVFLAIIVPTEWTC